MSARDHAAFAAAAVDPAVARPGRASGLRAPWLAGLLAWVLTTGGPALAADAAGAEASVAAQRERIARQRAAAHALHAERVYDCSRRFAVTDCTERARRERSAVLDALRREEEVLDAGERRRRAAERLESIRQKAEASARPRPALAPASSPERASGTPRSRRSDADSRDAGRVAPGRGGGDAGRRADRPATRRPAHAGHAPSEPDAAAAAQRAAATRERQERAANREAGRAATAASRPAAAPLPPRPEIPAPADRPASRP